MGLLTEDEKKEMALAHGKLFAAVCDKCEHLIKIGVPFVVLKYERLHRVDPKDRPYTWNRKVPRKVMCLDCNKELLPEPKKKIKLKGKGRKRVTSEEVAKINPMVKRLAIGMLKRSEEPIETAVFKNKVFQKARKKEPKIKKSVVNKTLSVLRKARVILCKKRHWLFPES